MSKKGRLDDLIADNKENALELSAANKLIATQKKKIQKQEAEFIIANKELAHKAELIILNNKLVLAIKREKLAKEKYTKLYNFAPSGYFTLTRKGKIIDLNLCGANFLGIKRQLSKNKRFDFFVSDDTKPIFNLFLTKVFMGKNDESCEVTLSLDGGKIPTFVYIKGHVIENGEQCLVTMLDISKNKKAENIINQNIGAWELNLIDGTVWRSLKHDQIFGYETLLPIWTFDIFIDHVISDDRALAKEKLNQSIATGSDFSFECRICRKDGSMCWIWVKGKPVLNEQRESVIIIGIVQDITKHKQAELELIEAKEKAEESERLKSAFLTNMSHEIRTPMNGILGFAELLKEPNLTGEEQQDYIRIIQKSGTRMLNTINNIVDISKIESELVNVDIKESNINEQIEFIYKFFKPEVESKGMQFFFKNSLPSKEAFIKTDIEKIYSILMNLVKNAIKFTNKGSIEFGYEKKGKYLEFFVKDTGIGISQKQKKIIFERFRQGNESYNQNYEGSGLGLTISKSYVEMLDGKLWVETQEGMGSIFYFTIPYNIVSEEKSSINNVVSEDYKEDHIKKLKVLVAEDDEISFSYMSRTLQKISNEVLHAKSGVEAIESCNDNPDIDLVMMDIRMPEMDGCEATRQIRQFNKDVIIIAQTAYAFSGDREKAIAAGCNDYISKPINKTLLYELINNHFKN